MHASLAVLGAVLSTGVGAQEIKVPVSADTSLFANNPANNLGASDSLAVGATGKGFPARGLMRVDLAGKVPEGSTVLAARLELSVVRVPPGDEASGLLVHRMLKDWTEGNGTGTLGRPAVAGEATWSHQRHPDGAWAAPGGLPGQEFVVEPSGGTTMNALGRYSIEGPGLAADVRAWLADPSANHGWILLSDKESTKLTARRIGSKESVNAADAPVLILTLGVAEGPSITRYGFVEGGFEIGFRAEAGNIYSVQYNPLGPGGTGWQTLTNVVAKLAPLDVTVLDPLLGGVGGQRFYRVADVGDVD
jgi:hypothetical protein